MNKAPVVRPLVQSVVGFAALAASFSAAAWSGPYFGIQGGATRLLDQELRRDPQPALRYTYNSGFIGGLVLGYADRSGFRPELALDFRGNDFAATTAEEGDASAYTLMSNLWWDLKTDSGVFSVAHPYIGGGIGAARVELREFPVDGESERSAFETLFAYQGGAGVSVDLWPRWTLSADYRFLRTDERSFEPDSGPLTARYSGDTAMLGLRYMFGPEVIAARDGVRVVPVAGDSDGDGVRDESDRCPDTPAGFQVNAEGCLSDQSVILRGVNFRFNSDQLTVPAQETLRQLSAALTGQADLQILIVGHADAIGSEEYNEALASLRAKSVRRFLVEKGVDSDTLIVRSAGEANPIADNDTPSGRAMNRRVEFVVNNGSDGVDVRTAEPTAQSKAAAEAGEPENLQLGNTGQSRVEGESVEQDNIEQ